MTDTIQRHLRQIPDLAALLPHFTHYGSKPADPDQPTITRTPDRPPMPLDVLDLADIRTKNLEPGDPLTNEHGVRRLGVLPTLQMWQMLIAGELHDLGRNPQPCCADTEDHSVAGECAWLLEHAVSDEVLELHPDLAPSIAGIHRDLARAVGENTTRPRLSCLQCGWDVAEADGGDWYSCTGCGKAWSRLELHRMAERNKPVTLKQAAKVAGVSVRTLSSLKAEGGLRPVARDGQADLFDRSAVLAAVARGRIGA